LCLYDRYKENDCSRYSIVLYNNRINATKLIHIPFRGNSGFVEHGIIYRFELIQSTKVQGVRCNMHGFVEKKSARSGMFFFISYA